MAASARALLPALPGLLALLVAWASFGGDLIDDAYITLTYARQLALGNGLVFHPALPVTEGYSDLLWALLLAVGLKLGLPGGALASGLGLVCSGLGLGWVAARLGGGRGAAAGVAIAASPIYGLWAGAGLEGGLFSLLLVVAVTSLGTGRGWLAFGLLGVTRVEGVAYGLVAVAHALVAERRLPTARHLVAWLGPTLAQLAFRLAFYGEVVPSPVRAKISAGTDQTLDAGLRWLSGVEVAEPALTVALGVAALIVAAQLARRRPVDPAAPWALVTVAGIAAFGVAVGGDWMPTLRFLQPAVLLGWMVVGGLLPRGPWLGLLAALSVAANAQVGEVRRNGEVSARELSAIREFLHSGPAPASLLPAHLFVLEYLGPDEAVILPDVGKLAWITGNPVLDPQGLAWRDVAEATRAGLSSVEGQARLEQIRATVQTLRPALVALLVTVDSELPSGPVATALLGANGRQAAPWFAAGWAEWGERPYSRGANLRYYLRQDLGPPPGPFERAARYREALDRAPEAAFLWTRLAPTLAALGDGLGAEAAAANIDPRARAMGEIWTR